MIKTLTAYTLEIDDVQLAVSEILNQLDIKNNLLKNSVGILTCYAEFIETGVIKELCKQLPFDVIGCTTIGNAVPGHFDRLMLGISVFTSDEVSFSASATKALAPDSYKQTLTNAYKEAALKLEKPAMMFVAAPVVFNVSGDDMVDVLDEVCGAIPIFGTIAADHTTDYSKSNVIYNGEASSDVLAMVVLSGPVNPVFSINSLSEENFLRQRGIVTSSERNILHSVNNMPVSQYFKDIGLAPEGNLDDFTSIAFIIDYNDGSKPVARGIYSVAPQGHAVCGGVIPKGAAIGVGTLDYAQVLETAKQSMNAVLAHTDKNNGLLVFSCIARTLTLGAFILDEMEKVQETLGGKIPYLMSYSGGEICPVYNEEGKPVNRYHNFTIVTCQF